jgi:Ca-activated chloride channel family protein
MAYLLAGSRARTRVGAAADQLIVAPRPRGAGLARAAAPLLVLALVATLGPAELRSFVQFGTTSELVEVYATVLDDRGNPVLSLTASDFTVLEDGVAQPISTFAAGEFPLTLAVAVDRSFSMGGERFEAAKAGARRLLGLVRADDRLLVLGIGGKVDVLAGFDADRTAARRALDDMQVWGTSPIGDVVAHGIDAVKGQSGRRAVVVWSDGVEREATVERADVLERARQSGVLIYPVAMASKPSPLLTALAALSGGRLIEARDRRSAEQAATAIAAELRHQYLLGYVPPAGPGGWRPITVRTVRPGLTVRARKGYLATGQGRRASF